MCEHNNSNQDCDKCCHDKGKSCSNDDCDNKQCSHDHNKPCNDDNCDKKDCCHAHDKPCNDDDCDKKDCCHAHDKPCNDDKCDNKDCCHSKNKDCGDDKCSKCNPKTPDHHDQPQPKPKPTPEPKPTPKPEHQPRPTPTPINNNTYNSSSSNSSNTINTNISNTNINDSRTNINNSKNSNVINNYDSHNITNVTNNNVSNNNTAITSIANVLKNNTTALGVGAVLSTINQSITNSTNKQQNTMIQNDNNFAENDTDTSIAALQKENKQISASVDVSSSGNAGSGRGELNDLVEQGADVTILFTAAALSQQPWHASFLSREAQIKLILLNQLVRGIDCSDDFYESASYDLFEVPPVITFDSVERTELKAFLAKSSFSTRFTNAKIRHFGGNVNIPFSPLSLDFIKSDNQKVDDHSATVNIAVMRNMYHARVVIRGTDYVLHPRFIHRIDEALSCDNLDDQYTALTDVFEEYGHLWCNKLYLGGKLYNYQENVEVKKGHEQEIKSQLSSQFSAAWYANARVNSKSGKASASAQDDSSSSMELHSRGGDPHLFQHPGAWTFSVRDWESWRVIDYIDLQPTYTLLDTERRTLIEKVLNRPKKKEQHNYIPYNTTVHVRRHGDGEIYPLSLLYGNQNTKTYALKDEHPIKGDGLHVVVFPEPGKWDYKVFKATTDGSEAEEFRHYIAGLRPYSIVLITQTWSGTPEPKHHTETAKTTFFSVCQQYLGLDVHKTEMDKKFNTAHGWLLVSYKDTQNNNSVRFSRHDHFQLEITVKDGHFISVGNGSDQHVDLPEPQEQLEYLKKTGWLNSDAVVSQTIQSSKKSQGQVSSNTQAISDTKSTKSLGQASSSSGTLAFSDTKSEGDTVISTKVTETFKVSSSSSVKEGAGKKTGFDIKKMFG